ncbi:hypothetical protein C2845_PM11G19700 [Panicum miliaceum]|uniref:Uncharacterized protein n=1 Tax=Panicum miliaceum TaxID=4540 RepID=A0A3L6RSJ8_PANMI|nr:hypothetical protein C2845_PM11G19700 [Panicum miliaceum]
MYHLDQDSQFDPIDRPTRGSIWMKRKPRWATSTTRLKYPAFVASFDQLTADRVR